MTRVNPLCQGEDSGLGHLESRPCRDVWPRKRDRTCDPIKDLRAPHVESGRLTRSHPQRIHGLHSYLASKGHRAVNSLRVVEGREDNISRQRLAPLTRATFTTSGNRATNRVNGGGGGFSPQSHLPKPGTRGRQIQRPAWRTGDTQCPPEPPAVREIMPVTKTLYIIRVLALLLIGAAAAAVLVLLGPPNANQMRSAATADYEANAQGAENVYQQQVTAMWGTKDMVEVVSRQVEDRRPPILIFLGVAAICVMGVTSYVPVPETEDRRTPTAQARPPYSTVPTVYPTTSQTPHEQPMPHPHQGTTTPRGGQPPPPGWG